MTRYRGGMWAPQGFYLEQDTWEARTVPKGGGILEGMENSIYIRLPVPPVLMPFLGAFLGGLYVIFLPLIAPALLVWLLGVKARKGLMSVKVRLLEGRRGA
ncbi:MAG: hypothetical protein HY347_07650 [candidate division NC10 bacterium]|nr:hypothetical protein [candidate division NC10 bacterium]